MRHIASATLASDCAAMCCVSLLSLSLSAYTPVWRDGWTHTKLHAMPILEHLETCREKVWQKHAIPQGHAAKGRLFARQDDLTQVPSSFYKECRSPTREPLRTACTVS